jgi:putative PIN family toxin of toxin-antitoxin system
VARARRARKRDIVAISEAVADEIREVLGRPIFARVLTLRRETEIAALLFTDAYWFVPTIRVTECRDPSDDKYLELVLAANVTILVSSDQDFLSLHRGAAFPFCGHPTTWHWRDCVARNQSVSVGAYQMDRLRENAGQHARCAITADCNGFDVVTSCPHACAPPPIPGPASPENLRFAARAMAGVLRIAATAAEIRPAGA